MINFLQDINAPSKAFLVICIPVRILCRYTFSMYFLILAACKGFSTLSYSFSIYYVVLILAPCKGFPPYVALLFLFTLFSFSDPFALALFHWILDFLFWYVKMLLKSSTRWYGDFIKNGILWRSHKLWRNHKLWRSHK